jgi:hypothetical protein
MRSRVGSAIARSAGRSSFITLKPMKLKDCLQFQYINMSLYENGSFCRALTYPLFLVFFAKSHTVAFLQLREQFLFQPVTVALSF